MAAKQQLLFINPADNVFRLHPLAACIRAAAAGSVLLAVATPAAAELPVPSAVWASMGGASREVVGNTMNIKQQTDKVILNWDKFNVSSDSTVNFKQPGSSSIALNKIAQQDPSKILGTVNANGQVYLVNKNGFVFGKDSQVNARGLVASTLDISERTLQEGIGKVSNVDQKLAALEGSGDFYRKNPDGSFQLDAKGDKIPIKIQIENGAKIQSEEGGRILVVAPTIENQGDVESPGGQVIMAAATDKVYLQEAPTDDTKANSDVRGLLVEVKTGGKIENLGNIAANRGNVTLMGFAVNQNGRVSATTSTNVNGSIRLLAREGGSAELINKEVVLRSASTTRSQDSGDGLGTSATVTLGENSKTNILPEVEYGEEIVPSKDGEPVKVVAEKTAIDGQAQPQSRIEMMAHKVHLKSGSEIVAPGAKVEVIATRSPSNPVADNRAVNDSRVLVDSGAKVDVSGTDSVVKAMESNIVAVELRNFELRDAPLQKTGILKGKTVLIDIRKGSPLTDIQPTLAGIKRTVAERLSKGGDIALKSEGDVITEQGSVLDVSGGQVTFRDGFITTSKLLANGRLIDISEADPLLKYDGIYGEVSKTYKKWGVTRTWQVDGPLALGRFEKGYIEGKDAGSLSVRAGKVLLQGQLLAHALNGRYQRDVADQAKGGRLEIDTGFTFENVQSIEFVANPNNPINVKLDDELPVGLSETLAFQAGSLFESGVRDAVFNSNGRISLAEDAKIRLLDGGSIKLRGGAIDIKGDIQGAGAKVELQTAVVTGDAGLDGDIILAGSASVDLQGQWINDFFQPDNIEGKSIAIDGGQFLAKVGGSAGGNLHLRKGSKIDVSGGGRLRSDRELKAGEGGTISLIAEPGEDNVGANIELDAVMSAYGLGQGGHFIAKANAVLIRRNDEEQASDGVKPLLLSTDFFNRGGFADFDIGANLNGLTVEDGAVISLAQQNRLLDAGYLNRANADGIAEFSRLITLPDYLRGPSALILRADHAAGSNPVSQLKIAPTARIVADAGSSIKLESDSSIVVDGTIVAHGGSVAMDIIPDKGPVDSQYQATQGIWLGQTARVDVSGTSESYIDGQGRRNGDVFDGGKISVNAQRGFLVSQAGSLLDVSGSQAELDLPASDSGALGAIYRPTLIGSHGGTIDLTAAEGAFIAGDMRAMPGAADGAGGGKLALFLNTDKRNDPDVENSSFPAAARTVILSQSKQVPLAGNFAKAGDALPLALNGKGYLSVAQIEAGGFSSLALAASGERGEIRFAGDLDLSLANSVALDAVKFGWQTPASGGIAAIHASYASLGSDVYRTPSTSPTAGTGKLRIDAELIDFVGGSMTAGFGSVDLQAKQDIRLKGIRIDNRELDFVGQFKTYSQLNLTAAQLYPTSLTNFSLGVEGDANGSITFSGHGAATPVMSAMGQLTVKAPNIEQNGVIKAPLGRITLEAAHSVKFGADSLTSVSAAGQIIPLGVTQGGLEWMLPLAGTGNNLNVANPDVAKSDTDKKAIFEAPQKVINVSADRIERAEGAVVDLSGGGDLLAYEFIPGDGGSRDVLAGSQAYAILPGVGDYAPFDPKAFPDSGLNVGDRVYLSGGAGLATGYYALLPARYALLPGAFLITPVEASGDVMPGSARNRVDGAAIVAGYRGIAGTGIRDQRWSEFVVENGAIAKTRSEYNLNYASQFFAERAERNEVAIPRLPQDAGQLVLNAKTALELPTVKADVPADGRGGFVDIVSDKLAIGATSATDDIELLASDIDKFKVDSLLLGAVRSFGATSGHTRLDVKAKSITIAQGTRVKAPELLLAAKEKVEIQAGAHIDASGEVAGNDRSDVLELSGDGALLRASAGKQVSVQRSGTSGVKGDLTIADGSTISAGSGSVLLDATRNTKMEGDLALTGGSLNMGAETINLGETEGVANGLSLDNQRLRQLKVSELVLTSRGMVNLYGELPQTNAEGEPFVFGDIVIDALGLAGKANTGRAAVLNAKSVTLANSHSGGNTLDGNGGGGLLVNTGQLVLGNGHYRLSGFSHVTVNAERQVLGRGDGRLTALADFTLNTPLWSAENGAKTTLDLPGHALTLGAVTGKAATAPAQGIAAQLWLEADNIDLNTAIAYKTGNVDLYALSGNIRLGDNALIDVSGARVAAGLSQPVAVNAGHIGLTALQGNINALAGSRLLLNAGDNDAAAGELKAIATAGDVKLAGEIQASGASKPKGGRITVDTGLMADGGFTDWSRLVANAGFSASVDFRLRNGDIKVDAGQTLSAMDIKLAADSGKITVNGTLDASGSDGGSIGLMAEDALTLAADARINAAATAANGDGGKVLLSALDRDADGAGIDIVAGARIDVSAQGNGNAGGVRLRADRRGADIDIASIAAGTVSGDSDVTIEAWRSYNATVVSQALQEVIHQDNEAYLAGIAANNVVETKFGAGYSISPGVEIRSSGNLVLNDAWDLSSWRYGTARVPGNLTLRAGGNLLLNQSLSDGFAYGVLDTPLGAFGVSDFLQVGASWSLNLLAGADLQAADRLAVKSTPGLSNPATSGDVKLANDVKLRTGTGDISVRAARDIVYGNANSVIYTAGRPDAENRFGSGGDLFAAFFYAEYPLDGGDIQLQAGRNINAKPTSQLLSDALVRTGNWHTDDSNGDGHAGQRPTAWGVSLGVSEISGYVSNPQQSVAAFGGGTVRISAGGNVNDLSVLIPTTGKAAGSKTFADDPTNMDFDTNFNQVSGGGELRLEVGGDVAGGVFYVDGGTAELSAGGSFKAGNNQGLKPILALGDAQFNLTSGKAMALEAIVDPIFATVPAPADIEGFQNRFFRYSADSAVKLTALSGDISLENDPKRLNEATNTALQENAFLIYPASLQVQALNGNLNSNKSFTLFPSAHGNLELYARGDITGNGLIHLSDADPAKLPSAFMPLDITDQQMTRVLTILDPLQPTSDAHADKPLHADDEHPVLISTGSGNIGSRGGSLGFVLAKPAEVWSGKDVIKTLFRIQHNNPGDVSVVHAGRDINFPVTFNPLNGIIDKVDQGIEVAGPGQLTALAGRDINLGASNGIVSSGNQANPALADNGADISVLPGLKAGGLDVGGFAADFITGRAEHAEESQQYQQRLWDEMRRFTANPNLTLQDAQTEFMRLSADDRLRIGAKLLGLVQRVFTQEVKRTATSLATATTKQGQDQAELEMLATIESLFPGSTLLAGNGGYAVDPVKGVLVSSQTTSGAILDAAYSKQSDRLSQGDVSLFLSTIQTADGGDVNIFVPNGGITVGLATADIGLEKAEDELGIIVKKQGDANLIARDDIDVNVRRVVTLGGGDILGGSSEGDVDAGRSPQTALAAPPLQVSYDAASQVILEVAPVLAGGGIRTVGAGNVVLFAPRGIIDAGEAGIAGNNVTLAATAIVGADNIDVGGTGVGVPVAPTGGIAAGLTGVSNLAASVSQAVEATTDVGKETASTLAKAAAAFGILSVEVLGFGE